MKHFQNHRLFRTLVGAILLLISFFAVSPVAAQTSQSVVSVSGRVTDASGQPIPGASVIVKGTTIGVTTTNNGSFSLHNVATGATVVVSFMGYADQEFSVLASKDVYDVVLAENDTLIDDVVVVGYGTQKKANLTGAVAQVTSKELENRPVANLGQALQGMVPNLNVTVSSGKPGAGASFQIRGTGSPNGGSPLILVDGVESYPDRINANDIETISVLKDAASAAIYGAKAAFGVILITTKSGSRNQKATVSYDGYFASRHRRPLPITRLAAIIRPASPIFSWSRVAAYVIPITPRPTIRPCGNGVTTRPNIPIVRGSLSTTALDAKATST